MNPFKLLSSYRTFKANNRYSYPFLFFAVSALKNLFQFTTLAIGGLLIFQLGSGSWDSHFVSANMTQVPVEMTQQSSGNQAVEVLAVANTDETLRVNQFIKPVLPEATLIIEKKARQLFTWEWILKQNENKFTIQFGSSPDKERLYETANSFPTDDAVAVFPFKKTPSNRTVYGFSSGLYDSLEMAQIAIEDLPDGARSFGPWIRPIGQLQKEIVVTLAK